MKRNPLTLFIGAVLIVLFALLLFVFQVRQTEVAVVTTFSKPTRPLTLPGPYFKLPWPIQKVYKFDQRIQNLDPDKFDEAWTLDKKPLLTQTYVGWRIKDAQAFYPKFPSGSITEAQRRLEDLIRNEKGTVVSRHTLADFISAGQDQNKLTVIEKEILEAVRTQVHSQAYGIEIEFLGFKKLGLPESVTQDVFNRMKSEREEDVSRLTNEGERDAQKIRSTAEREAAGRLAEAKARATQIAGRGEAEAAASLETFAREPALASFLFRLSALEASLKDRATLIFDQQTPPFDLLRAGSATNLLTK
jgi:modulator of FtsH protease HflC